MSFDPASFAAVLARHQLGAESQQQKTPPNQTSDTPADVEAATNERNDSPMADTDIEQVAAEAAAKATAEATARFTAVLASEHYAGREQLAATLLGQPALSADAVIAALAAAPKPNVDAGNDADALAALAAARAGNPPPLGGDGGIVQTDGWAAIYDELNAAA